MNILVMDAQGGGIGKQVVTAVRTRFPDATITAVGTNAAATTAMLRAGQTKARRAKTPPWSAAGGPT